MKVQFYISEEVRTDAIGSKLVALLHRQVEPTDQTPDLVHILGCGSLQAQRHAQNLSRRLIPYIISPLGALQPWTPRSILHATLPHNKTTALQKATAIHFCSDIEEQNGNRQEWHEKTVVIKNPIVTTAIDEATFTKRITELYQHAIDQHDQQVRKQIADRVTALGENETTICNLLQEILYIRYQHHQGKIHTDTAMQLGEAMTAANYDEDLMAQRLEQLHLYRFTARLEYAMQQQGFLTEGFMPIPALADKVSFRLLPLLPIRSQEPSN